MDKYTLLMMIFPLLLYGQPETVTAIDEKTGESMLLGPCQRARLLEQPYGEWFQEEYENYAVDEAGLLPVQDLFGEVQIKLFFGTWCSDSRREVPRLFQILDWAEYNPENLELICVDRKMHSPGNEEKGLDIHHVPTIIFYRDGRELGRIIESPIESLEADIATILLGLPYKPNYTE
jgi:thiol-disulfide isomerase/thioredoxin